MNVETLMEWIRLPDAARRELGKLRINDKEYAACRETFFEREDEFLKRWEKREDPGKYLWALAFYLRLAADAYASYQERRIEDRVYADTMYDITIWCLEWKRKSGEYGLNELFWIGRSVKLELFRLGRLQFEPCELRKVLNGKQTEYPAGTKALNVHIPAGEPLLPQGCKDSFRQAKDFFRETYPIFVCDSWLLSPELKKLLPMESNILCFQRMFEILTLHYDFPQAEQRIFGDILEDKTQYPEYTVLQRHAKQYILAGNDPGIGIGIRRGV